MKHPKILFQLFVFMIFTSAVFGQLTRPRATDLQTTSGSIQKMESVQTPVNNSSAGQLCFDQFPNVNIPNKPIYQSPSALPTFKSNGELVYPSSIKPGLTSFNILTWNPGDVITVGFEKNQTTDYVINKVKQYAKEWEKVANVKFSFVDDVNNALIRVGFDKQGGDWSWLGRMAAGNILKLKTMNFGFFNNNTPESEFRATTMHEFGHALGFVHEHRSPATGIPWDKEKVYAYYAAPPLNWSRQQVDANVFFKYSTLITNSSTYDRNSIMHYYFPSSLTLDGSSFPKNTNFSATDISFAGFVYPFPPRLVNSRGTLQTGDDCDAIDFSLEFNVVDPNFVEFILQPGVDPWGRIITWWKQIGIPMKGGVETPIQLRADGRPEVMRLPVNMLDYNRYLSFAKAKTLGVHTALGYKWNALPAIKGGCRLTLTWQQDACNKTP